MSLKRDAAHISVIRTISNRKVGAMTLEHTELSSLVSDADLADLHAITEAVRDGMAKIKEYHPAYNWVWTDEIECRGCRDRLEIPPLKSTSPVADRVFEDHQQFHLQHMLNENERYNGA